MPNMLDGKVAFITGGASGIGRGAAERFAQEAAKIAIADVSPPEEAEEVRAAIERRGGQVVYFQCDVSDPAQVKKAVDGTVAKFGRLDVVFANAGINGVWTPIEELQPDEWDKTLNINLKGTYLTVHHAIPHLRKAGGGSVIITSSVNGTRTFSNAGASAYSTSKAGQIAFMKMAALELARYDIRVNAVCPGAIHTNIDESTHKRHTEKVEVKVVLPEGNAGIDHGVGDPGEVADTCLFLASELSRHVSGVEIYVDGGASLLR
jgi:NAD(P)-dependent dehydrogenase (short-subunit alcohol dehydrogenase family)